MEPTLKEKIEKIKNFRPIDDVFFEVLAANTAVCQEILSTILEDKGLVVENAVVQSSIRNLYGRSVRLDCLCTLGNGKKVNIEVQRSDNDNHFKRVRYNESVVTAKETNAGDTFDSITDLIVVYISEFDFIKGGKTTYHVDKIIRETGETVEDGVKEPIFRKGNGRRRMSPPRNIQVASATCGPRSPFPRRYRNRRSIPTPGAFPRQSR